MKPSYQRFVELSNKGARELGFADTGAMWRSRYDMAPDAFAKELDRLWEQLRPLYLSLHTHVRAKLREKYGDAVPERGPIPAHLLGNIWAQDWSNVYDIAAPRDTPTHVLAHDDPAVAKVSPLDMVRYGEGFFTSLGFAPLPKTFWERSLFVKPRDRDVVCHASAWYIDNADDLRIKMCIDPTDEDFTTVHHELGHDFYGREYKTQPMIFRDSANDGFHEAIGDTIALSVTPEYLVKIGLLDKAPDASGDIPLLLRRGAREAGVPAVRPGRGSVAMAGVQRPGEARPVQRGMVEAARAVSGRGAAVARAASSSSIRAPSITCRRTRRTRRYFLAAVLQFQFHRELAQDGGLHDAAPPLLDLRQHGRRRAAEKDAGDGRVPPVARCARSAHRAAADGCHARSPTTSRR